MSLKTLFKLIQSVRLGCMSLFNMLQPVKWNQVKKNSIFRFFFRVHTCAST